MFQQFEEECILSEFRPMATYWNSFIDMVQILLDYIKSTRTGDWHVHLQASECMLNWYFEYYQLLSPFFIQLDDTVETERGIPNYVRRGLTKLFWREKSIL